MIIHTCPRCSHELDQTLLLVNPPIHIFTCHQCGYYDEEREDVKYEGHKKSDVIQNHVLLK